MLNFGLNFEWVTYSDVPDPDPDPDFFINLGSGRTQIRIVFFKLEPGRNRFRIFFFKLGSGR